MDNLLYFESTFNLVNGMSTHVRTLESTLFLYSLDI